MLFYDNVMLAPPCCVIWLVNKSIPSECWNSPRVLENSRDFHKLMQNICHVQVNSKSLFFGGALFSLEVEVVFRCETREDLGSVSGNYRT